MSRNVMDIMTIVTIGSQRPLLANMILKILLEKSFQLLMTHYMIFKTNKIVRALTIIFG